MICTGLHALTHDEINLLDGLAIGLVTNATGIDGQFLSNVDWFHSSDACQLAAIFAPEHGLHAVHQDGHTVTTHRDPRTDTPVYSLFGETRKPTAEMLQGVDVLVYDIQDIGARFYTFITTLAYLLESAAEHGVPVVVLDRPNPINGVFVEGPLLEPDLESFVGAGRLPVRHGLTVAELARFFCHERDIEVDLTTIPMQGWQRTMWYDETELPWVMPSPNMPTLDTATVYPGACLIEGTNVSEGRGTTRPFELVGAPWIDAHRLAEHLNNEHLLGIHFRPSYFMPVFSKHQEQACQGVQWHVLDRDVFQPLAAGIALLEALHKLYPDDFSWREYHERYSVDRLVGTTTLRHDIDVGRPWQEIIDAWSDPISQFRRDRQSWLLY